MAVLVVVTRLPGSARAKTRLARGVGASVAGRLQDAFLDDTLAWVAELAPDRVLAVHPAEGARELAVRAPGFRIVGQHGESFGERMRGAVNAGFAQGREGPVAMIATDSPTLPPRIVCEAWASVSGPRAADVALSPAQDGGWVAIAAREALPPGCFAGVRWSAPQTLGDTVSALGAVGLEVALVEGWHDIDIADDLARLARELGERGAPALPHTRAVLGASAFGFGETSAALEGHKKPRTMSGLPTSTGTPRVVRAAELSARIPWISVLRVALGALFVSVFFDNLEKKLYTPGPSARLIDGYAARSTGPGFWRHGVMGFVSDHATTLAPAQAVFELSLAILLVLGIANGVVALIAAGHLTALWVSELGILWVWELLSLIIIAVVVGLAALPSLADRSIPAGRRLLGARTFGGLALPGRLAVAVVGGVALGLVSLAAHTGGGAHYHAVALESGLVFGGLLVALALLDVVRR